MSAIGQRRLHCMAS